MGAFRDELLAMVTRLVTGEWSVPEFEAHYYRHYLDGPEAELSDREHELFGALQEALDFTAHRPDRQSAADGWVDHDTYRRWAARALEAFRAGGELPHYLDARARPRQPSQSLWRHMPLATLLLSVLLVLLLAWHLWAAV